MLRQWCLLADAGMSLLFLLLLGAAATEGQLYYNTAYAPIWPYTTPHPHPKPTQGSKQMPTTARPRTPALLINLSDFVLMFVLKVVVFIIGEYGFTLGLGTTGKRSAPSLQHFQDGHLFFTSDRELEWAIRFVSGEDKDLQCLYQLACQEPDTGTLYRNSARTVVQIMTFLHSIMQPSTIQKFKTISQELDASVNAGLFGKSCPDKCNCSDVT